MLLKSKHLLGIEELTVEEINLILDTANSFKEVLARPIKKVPALRGKTIMNLFFEPSTRTRTSFELAAKRLSADVVNISPSTSSVVKGESLSDTVKNMEAMNIDIIIVRHSTPGAPHLIARTVQSSVINAGDGAHEHPTQALLDLFTIRKKKGEIKNLNVAIIGDIAHSRVARSNIWGLTKMGAKVTLVAPPTLIPRGIEKLKVKISYNIEEVIKNTDVIMLLRIQRERQKKNLFPSVREYARFFGLDRERLGKAPENVIIMHPGPLNRGVEISDEVADSVRSVILEQVSNGLAVRMAVLYLLAGAGRKL